MRIKKVKSLTDQVSPLSTKTAYTFLVGDYNINLWRDGYDYPCIPIGDVIFASERNGNQRPIKSVPRISKTFLVAPGFFSEPT